MAPSAVPVQEYAPTTGMSDFRASKRLKTGSQPREEDASEDALPAHPYHVKPEGNAFAEEVGSNLKWNLGVFATLPDELLAHCLEYLTALQLVSLGSTCKAFYAFTRSEELWKTLFVESLPSDFQWRGSWRSTYLKIPADSETKISCHGLYSDVLYRPFFCAYTSLRKYSANIPSGNAIPRLEDLSHDEYSSKWSDKPFILTAPVKEWPIYSQWNTDSLFAQYGDTVFRAEAVDWSLKSYVSYMTHNADESPLYLFDRAFAEKMNLKTGKRDTGAVYWAPECFGEDLFTVLRDQRPDSRWMIMGPARSGSTFHKDPNATSAWNAVLTGSKYWLMFPSSSTLPPPPGVILSEDASEITSPLSIAEYLLGFHELARATLGCREGICYAGEVLHVPSGWFHLVLNLEESIALTQNFVPRKKICEVLRFLRDSPEQVSGFKDDVKDPYSLFVEKLGVLHPDFLEEGLRELKSKNLGRRGRWEALVKPTEPVEGESTTGGFSFGFGGADDDDADIP